MKKQSSFITFGVKHLKNLYFKLTPILPQEVVDLPLQVEASGLPWEG
jgi:hypothetical protein